MSDVKAKVITELKIVCPACHRRWKERRGKFPPKCPRCRTPLEPKR